MEMIKWEPFRDMWSTQRRMNRLFCDHLREPESTELSMGSWIPAVDIFEDEGEVVLKAELPEIDRKDVKISIEGNTLTLSGSRNLDKETERDKYRRVERSYGSFSRAFSLPTTLDQEQVKADYKDGILRITLPKKPEHKPKQITVNVN